MDLFLSITSLLAFIMSTITWIFNFLDRQISVEVEIKDFAMHWDIVQLYLYIQNNSRSPFTISGVSIISNSKKHPCEPLSKIIRTHNDEVTLRTPYFPVNFSAHQGQCLALEFLHCPDIELAPGKTVVLEIYTNRKILRKSLTVPQPDRILHLH